MAFYARRKTGWLIAVILFSIVMMTYLSTTAEQENTLATTNQTSDTTSVRPKLTALTNRFHNDSKREMFVTKVDVRTSEVVNNQATVREVLVKGNGTYNLSMPRGQLRVMNSEGRHIQSPLSWSQYGQDMMIDNYFFSRKHGFFVEIGGYNGETNSNTLLLEKERGWDGLLVEANPYLYKQMLEKNRKCYMINCCISNDEPEMTFLLADALTAAGNVLSKEHKDRIDKEENTSLSSMHYGESVKTQCFSLMDILDVIGRRHIDYFSLDVEGGEMYILKSIDFDKLDITFFTIETDQHRYDILKFMEEKGYDLKHNILGDDVFKKRGLNSV